MFYNQKATAIFLGFWLPIGTTFWAEVEGVLFCENDSTHPMTTWWLIPLRKWVITPVINGIRRVNPLIIGVITHLRAVGWATKQVPHRAGDDCLSPQLPSSWDQVPMAAMEPGRLRPVIPVVVWLLLLQVLPLLLQPIYKRNMQIQIIYIL